MDAFLQARLAQVWAPGFAEPLRYPVFAGGKRVRPALCFAAYDALAKAPDVPARAPDVPAPVLPAAAAVELVHSYSLVHDDLPAMDDDDERRGQPTVHVRFGEAVAILVGDALLTEAFAVLAASELSAEQRVAQIAALAGASGHLGMVGGQVADIAGDDADLECLTRLHRAKTGALITASCTLGGIAAGAGAQALAALEAYGQAVGLAFQLADDVLDAAEDAGEGGPPSFVRLLGLDATRARAAALADEAIEAAQALPRPGALVALARFSVERSV
ncbi:MAG TPA: geranyl transferase [Deltaproteobacteria bacterium]|nr:geranyl transferase [Deltaproteobacteria bacterium]